jgi:Flp pilus assembly pilin Flp
MVPLVATGDCGKNGPGGDRTGGNRVGGRLGARAFYISVFGSSRPTRWGNQNVSSIVERAKDLLASEDGAAAVEYTIMLALILLACIAAVGGLGESVSDIFVTASEIGG